MWCRQSNTLGRKAEEEREGVEGGGRGGWVETAPLLSDGGRRHVSRRGTPQTRVWEFKLTEKVPTDKTRLPREIKVLAF